MIEPRELPDGERQLFLDLEDIADRENVAHTLHQPDKRGPVIEPEGSSLQITCAPCGSLKTAVTKSG